MMCIAEKASLRRLLSWHAPSRWPTIADNVPSCPTFLQSVRSVHETPGVRELIFGKFHRFGRVTGDADLCQHFANEL
jgi:hypothetical protein